MRRIVDSTTATDQSVGNVRQSPTASQSRFGPPVAPVAVARTVFAPAVSPTRTRTVCQPDGPPVAGKSTVLAAVPLTEICTGCGPGVALANRNVRFCLPGRAALTVHS